MRGLAPPFEGVFVCIPHLWVVSLTPPGSGGLGPPEDHTPPLGVDDTSRRGGAIIGVTFRADRRDRRDPNHPNLFRAGSYNRRDPDNPNRCNGDPPPLRRGFLASGWWERPG
jgi:hypothetical protein